MSWTGRIIHAAITSTPALPSAAWLRSSVPPSRLLSRRYRRLFYDRIPRGGGPARLPAVRPVRLGRPYPLRSGIRGRPWRANRAAAGDFPGAAPTSRGTEIFSLIHSRASRTGNSTAAQPARSVDRSSTTRPTVSSTYSPPDCRLLRWPSDLNPEEIAPTLSSARDSLVDRSPRRPSFRTPTGLSFKPSPRTAARLLTAGSAHALGASSRPSRRRVEEPHGRRRPLLRPGPRQ